METLLKELMAVCAGQAVKADKKIGTLERKLEKARKEVEELEAALKEAKKEVASSEARRKAKEEILRRALAECKAVNAAPASTSKKKEVKTESKESGLLVPKEEQEKPAPTPASGQEPKKKEMKAKSLKEANLESLLKTMPPPPKKKSSSMKEAYWRDLLRDMPPAQEPERKEVKAASKESGVLVPKREQEKPAPATAPVATAPAAPPVAPVPDTEQKSERKEEEFDTIDLGGIEYQLLVGKAFADECREMVLGAPEEEQEGKLEELLNMGVIAPI